MRETKGKEGNEESEEKFETTTHLLRHAHNNISVLLQGLRGNQIMTTIARFSQEKGERRRGPFEFGVRGGNRFVR